MKKEKSRSTNWGGTRENAGRKSIWNHKETCTIRIPQVFALKIHEIAKKLDKNSSLEFDINSREPKDEDVSNSSHKDDELETESSMRGFDSVTKTNRDLSQAIDLARQILRHKKSARISFAKFLSKFYFEKFPAFSYIELTVQSPICSSGESGLTNKYIDRPPRFRCTSFFSTDPGALS